MKLDKKVAVVTGASSGLGRTLSELFVKAGATVFGLARRKERLAEIHDVLGDTFTGIQCNVRSPEDVRASFKEIAEAASTIDVLINNAGLGRFGPLENMSVDDFDKQSETNIRGVFLCSRQVIPIMRKQNDATGFGGHIVNIASVAGLIGNANIGAYNATKFAVRGLSEAMMKELRYDGIKVSCVYPGSFDTEFFDVAGTELRGRAMTVDSVASTVMHLLQTDDEYLISEVVMRPLRPNS